MAEARHEREDSIVENGGTVTVSLSLSLSISVSLSLFTLSSSSSSSLLHDEGMCYSSRL